MTAPSFISGGCTVHTCDICGYCYQDNFTDPLPYMAGDTDGNSLTDTDDAIYLLYFTLFGEGEYSLSAPSDFDGNGVVDTDDAIYLLYYTLFGEELYPLN